MRPASIIHRQSAGGIVFRRVEDYVQVALISVNKGKVWTLPKGLTDGKEKVRKTALREVREETGLTARIISEIGESSYWYEIRSLNAKCRKTVLFFLMEYVSGSVSDHDDEVDSAEWFPLEIALDMLIFKGDRAIMEKAAKMIKRRMGREKKKSE